MTPKAIRIKSQAMIRSIFIVIVFHVSVNLHSQENSTDTLFYKIGEVGACGDTSKNWNCDCISGVFYPDCAPPYTDMLPTEVQFDCAPCNDCVVIITDVSGTLEVIGRFLNGYQEGEFITKSYIGRAETPSLRIKYYQKGVELLSLHYSGGRFFSLGLNCKRQIGCDYILHNEDINEILH